MPEKRYVHAKATLEEHGQAHLLAFYDELDDDQRVGLLDQIEQIDFDQVDRLIESHVKAKPQFELPEDTSPAPYYPVRPTDDLIGRYAEARRRGDELLRQGKVGAFVVAGGSGTRLGWPGPKGTFPATPVSAMPLFQVFAAYLRKVQDKYDAIVPWYIMTSPANDAETRAFFEEHRHFELDPANVRFFAQGTMPCIGYDGKILLDDKHEIARSADGHGGSLKALARGGALDDMTQRGIEHLSYFQVDNPLVKCVDPLFIGLHALDNAQMSSKMIPKNGPREKLGNFCVIDGRVNVIEYSDLPDELAEQRTAGGELRFLAGSIAIHVIAAEFVQRLNAGELSLPWHRADKKIPHLDLATGARIEPTQPNGVKLEQFVFDALPLCDSSVVLETVREEEFGPIKNAEGPDSPQTSRKLQVNRAGRWLAQVGVTVPHDKQGAVDATIELSPLTAIEPDDLKQVDLPDRIDAGAKVAL